MNIDELEMGTENNITCRNDRNDKIQVNLTRELHNTYKENNSGPHSLGGI